MNAKLQKYIEEQGTVTVPALMAHFGIPYAEARAAVRDMVARNLLAASGELAFTYKAPPERPEVKKKPSSRSRTFSEFMRDREERQKRVEEQEEQLKRMRDELEEHRKRMEAIAPPDEEEDTPEWQDEETRRRVMRERFFAWKARKTAAQNAHVGGDDGKNDDKDDDKDDDDDEDASGKGGILQAAYNAVRRYLNTEVFRLENGLLLFPDYRLGENRLCLEMKEVNGEYRYVMEDNFAAVSKKINAASEEKRRKAAEILEKHKVTATQNGLFIAVQNVAQTFTHYVALVSAVREIAES